MKRVLTDSAEGTPPRFKVRLSSSNAELAVSYELAVVYENDERKAVGRAVGLIADALTRGERSLTIEVAVDEGL